MRLPSGERGAVYPYLVFWIGVVFFALIWIAFNEVILHVGDWQASSAEGDPGFTWAILITLCRSTPWVVLFGAFVWAVVVSHREGQVG